MSDKLKEICDRKRQEVEQRKLQTPIAALEAQLGSDAPRGFLQHLREKSDRGQLALIAEIKKASPSKGLIRADFDPRSLAVAYREGGATCLSVLTESHYFQGSDEALKQARAAASLPALRKDFTIDPYQVVEARAIGADAVLLIVAALSDAELASLCELSATFDLDVLMEVHNREELERALETDVELIVINNRNLKTLEVRTETTIELARLVPNNRLIIAESGLFAFDDLCRMRDAGARAFLVGEALMRQDDVTAATRTLLGLDVAA